MPSWVFIAVWGAVIIGAGITMRARSLSFLKAHPHETLLLLALPGVLGWLYASNAWVLRAFVTGSVATIVLPSISLVVLCVLYPRVRHRPLLASLWGFTVMASAVTVLEFVVRSLTGHRPYLTNWEWSFVEVGLPDWAVIEVYVSEFYWLVLRVVFVGLAARISTAHGFLMVALVMYERALNAGSVADWRYLTPDAASAALSVHALVVVNMGAEVALNVLLLGALVRYANRRPTVRVIAALMAAGVAQTTLSVLSWLAVIPWPLVVGYYPGEAVVIEWGPAAWEVLERTLKFLLFLVLSGVVVWWVGRRRKVADV